MLFREPHSLAIASCTKAGHYTFSQTYIHGEPVRKATIALLLMVAAFALCSPASAQNSKNYPKTDAQKQADKEWRKTNKKQMKAQKKQTKQEKKAMKDWKKQHPEVRTVT